ncbi:hypothetical protein AMTRI_Chr13g82540 [Amborella trichopoda]
MAGRQRAAAALPLLLRTLRNASSPPLPKPLTKPLPSLRHAFSLYDQINLINRVSEEQLRFEGFSDTGFTINGVQYEGSVLCVGSLVLSWSPKKLSEITADSLSVLQLLRPAPEIFVLGCGRFTVPIDPELMRFIRSNGMKLEAIDSRNAASTFNILNEEGRMVAAALLPYRVQE